MRHCELLDPPVTGLDIRLQALGVGIYPIEMFNPVDYLSHWVME